MTEAFWGEFDLASLSLWLFWFFFAALVIYLQRENMREGYPLEDDAGETSSNPGLLPLPDDKTFRLPHDRGKVTVPSGQGAERSDLAITKVTPSNGYPLEPTGDPMHDGIGPAAWAPRRDVPELDGHGSPKIVPTGRSGKHQVSAGRDPRGLPVIAGDGVAVGTVTDLWVDSSEQLVRYLEFRLDPEWGEGQCLVPLTQARIWFGKVRITSLFARQFAAIPRHAATSHVTLLEEEKICAYYGGGHLYADSRRQEPQLA